MQSTSRVSSRTRRSSARWPKVGERTAGWNLTTPPLLLLVLDIPGTPVLIYTAFVNITFSVFTSRLGSFCTFAQFLFILMYGWPIFCSRGLRKRSISPVQGEQGAGDTLIADGWSHYSYPDSTGSKKMKTDGVWTYSCISTFLLQCGACSRFSQVKYSAEIQPWGRGQVALWIIVTTNEIY